MDQAFRARRTLKSGRGFSSRAFVSNVAAFCSFIFLFATLILTLVLSSGCAPKVVIQAPQKPIEINLNIKIEHEIRVKVDNDLEQLFEDDDELF
jgi:hypothetical protein